MLEILTAGPTVLRRWRSTDAAALDAALRANLDHLRPWMSWIANEPLPLDRRRAQMQRWSQRWDAGEKYGWGTYTEDTLIGACDVARGDCDDEWVIGYWIAADQLGQGHARRAGGLITNAAFETLGASAVTAVCDAANAGSNAVLTSLGFGLERAFDGDIFAPGETGRVHVYRRDTPIPT